jgi:hypothetical protein
MAIRTHAVDKLSNLVDSRHCLRPWIALQPYSLYISIRRISNIRMFSYVVVYSHTNTLLKFLYLSVSCSFTLIVQEYTVCRCRWRQFRIGKILWLASLNLWKDLTTMPDYVLLCFRAVETFRGYPLSKPRLLRRQTGQLPHWTSTQESRQHPVRRWFRPVQGVRCTGDFSPTHPLSQR